ncbi:MAG: Cof-type HAD-IIB family hydrolase [Candidatus Coproplasma sp.]
MNKLNYKLIVSDFDGTLANSKNEVPPFVVEEVNRYVKNGGIFAVCTGRILPSILPRVREMGFNGLVIASQGCQIAEIATGKLIKNSVFSREQANEICTYLEGINQNIQLYSDSCFYSTLPNDEPHLNLYESIIGIKALHLDVPLSRFVLSVEPQFCKVAILVHQNERQSLYEILKARFSGEFDVTCSAKVLIEISPLGVTKGEALKFLADKYGIDMRQTIAIGDNLNDMSMVEAAGLGCAVGNGEEELKRIAAYVAPTCDEGGVAEVIKKFGYENG